MEEELFYSKTPRQEDSNQRDGSKLSDAEIDRLWIEEAQRRLEARLAGRVKGIAAEDVVGPF